MGELLLLSVESEALIPFKEAEWENGGEIID